MTGVQTCALPIFRPDDAALRAAVAEYLAPLRDRGIGSLILGCTHYGLIEEAIRGFLGPEVRLIEAASCAANELADELCAKGLCGGTGEERFFTSGSPEEFRRLSTIFLGREPRGEVVHAGEMEA